MMQPASVTRPEALPEAPWLRRFPVRTPTLPPATHTNTYIVGSKRLVVIDPASPYPEEQSALAAWLDELVGQGQRIAALLLTHHHIDHISGAAALARHLGVPVAAHPETARLVADRVPIDQLISPEDRIDLGDVPLRALYTPGHAPGHLCFHEPRSGAILAGDMVASVGSIIIDPPEGDMRLYLGSLERLRGLGSRWLLPAHGAPVADPDLLLSHYLRHRLDREARILGALSATPTPIPDLVPRAYPDVAPAIYPLAARSLLAHLLKLRDEGRAIAVDGDGDGVLGAWRLA